MLTSLSLFAGMPILCLLTMGCLACVLNVKVLLGTFNQEKALGGAFSVIVKNDAMDRLQL